MILLLKMAPKYGADVPKCKQAMIYILENIYVWEKLRPGMSYSAAGHDFIMNEGTTQ